MECKQTHEFIELVRARVSYNPLSGEFTWAARGKGRAGRGPRIKNSGYLAISIDGRLYRSHRIAWLLVHGEMPDGQIDHINGDRLDNRMSNLRVTTAQGNARNRKLPSNNKTGISGVFFDKGVNYWRAVIGDGASQKNIGCSKDFFEACCMRKSEEVKLGYHINHGRA